MFCTNCGTNNADGVKFCSGCGMPMNNSEPTPVQPQAPVYYAPVEPVAPMAPAPAPQKPKNNTGLIVGIIVGVLVIIGAVIAILFATGTFDTGSEKEKTEETGKKKQDKENKEEEDKDEEDVETSKGDETHDGRIIGTWTGYEKTEMEGYEVELDVTYTFNEDGTYEMEYDYDQYAQAMKEVMLQMMYDQYGYSEAEANKMFEKAYGMDVEGYAESAAEEFKTRQKSVTTYWETDGTNLKSTAKSKDTNVEVSSSLEYTFSADGNTMYFSGEIYGVNVIGEYTREK